MSIKQCKNYNAERNSTITVKYADIPNYLRDSEFYKSLSDEDPESTIEIPNNCFKPDTIIETDYDFYCHLRTFQFWIFETIPTHVLDYCSRTDYNVWKDTAHDLLSKKLFGYLTKSFYKMEKKMRLSDLPLYFLPYWIKHNPPQHAWAGFTTEAAADGALQVLQFLHKYRYPVDTATCSTAARWGHLECLQFLHESGCPWDTDTCASAAHNGYFECLRYAHEHGCPWDDAVIEQLCKNSHELGLECMRYVLQGGCPIHVDACSSVIRTNQFDYLLLLHEYHAPWDAYAMRIAVEKDNIQIVQYLYEHGCPWNEKVVEAATTVTMLSFLFERGCPFSEKLLVLSQLWSPYKVAFIHRLACLQCLIEVQGMYMPEDGSLFLKALLCTDYEGVQYLIDQGCPWGITVLSENVMRDDQLHIDSMCRYMGMNEPNSEYDARLLRCLQYAVEHGWQYDRSIIECVCKLALVTCMEYFLDQQQIVLSIVREETVTDDLPDITYTAIFDE